MHSNKLAQSDSVVNSNNPRDCLFEGKHLDKRSGCR